MIDELNNQDEENERLREEINELIDEEVELLKQKEDAEQAIEYLQDELQKVNRNAEHDQEENGKLM